jgi:hypothetical protein
MEYISGWSIHGQVVAIFFLVKKEVSSMWRQYGDVEVFSLENGMFIFQLQDEASCDDILDSWVWHVSNEPLIMRKWQLGMLL